MASGNQKVKTPSGWNATQGAWVKTGASTWKAVDQIYIKTPDGWNNCLLYTSPSPRDATLSRMPSSA